MEPLTPNTAAFLSYLNSSDDFSAVYNPVSDPSLGGSSNNVNANAGVKAIYSNNNTVLDSHGNPIITSLPPSAIFPVVSGGSSRLITPETTPPSQNDSPEVVDVKPIVVISSGSESDGDDEPSSKKTGTKGDGHKRKANAKTQRNHKSALDEGTDSDMTGHEDKRQHHAGRKPRDSEEGLSKKDKAARRKEQNRAAQKAFRERREAKVSNLEEKLAEVEAKSYGVTLENENLRGMLKRLQEENVALKQSAFTFTMPITQSPAQNPIQTQNQKPPTPPHSNSDDTLKTIGEINQSPISHPSTGSSMSSQNLFSSPPRLSSGDSFPSLSRSSTGISPMSTSSDNKSEIDALWASFYPNGVPNISPQSFLPVNQNNYQQPQLQQQLQQQQQHQQQQRSQALLQMPIQNHWNLSNNLPYDPFPMNSIQPNHNPNMAYREAPAVSVPEPAAAPSTGLNDFDWSSLGNIDDFLASLTDNTETKQEEIVPIDDDTFNAQLAQILGDNTFSPSKYLNMSPSPLPSDANTSSNSASPASQQPSSATSPESSAGSSSSVSGQSLSMTASASAANKTVTVTASCPEKAGNAIVHVLDKQGNIIKPSDLWVHMGMQHQSAVDSLVIDDLCDQMKAKATCKDGQTAITVDNLQHMLRYNTEQADHNEQAKGLWGRKTGTVPSMTV